MVRSSSVPSQAAAGLERRGSLTDALHNVRTSLLLESNTPALDTTGSGGGTDAPATGRKAGIMRSARSRRCWQWAASGQVKVAAASSVMNSRRLLSNIALGDRKGWYRAAGRCLNRAESCRSGPAYEMTISHTLGVEFSVWWAAQGLDGAIGGGSRACAKPDQRKPTLQV